MNSLLHPELLDLIPFVGGSIKEKLVDLADDVTNDGLEDPDLSIVVRTLNEAEPLKRLLADIHSQQFDGEVEVIVVDNESTDDTAKLVHESGCSLLTIPRNEFTYPKSMNIGVEAANHDLVFLTVGHALLSNSVLLRSGARHFVDPRVAGVYGASLPSTNISSIERVTAMFGGSIFCKPTIINKAALGVMKATCAMIRKSAWEELGKFDERYESGGEDTALAAEMLKRGDTVVREGLLSVHHYHGLGVRDSALQWAHWSKTLRGPVPLSEHQLAKRRRNIDSRPKS